MAVPANDRAESCHRWLILAILGMALLLSLNSLDTAGQLHGQDPVLEPVASSQNESQPGNQGDRPALPFLYFGVKACATAGCHEKGQTADPLLVCRCDEMDRLKENDKHADAFAALKGDLGQSMLKKLKLDGPLKAPACLSCHSMVIEDERQIHDDTFSREDGIGCGVCHGAHKAWVGEHSFVLSRKEFRNLSRQTKQTKYGMTDLWNPITRTKLCASCHIGNHAQGKFVTHEMYAAGHPPLPSFEINTFSEQMPRHWELLRVKPKEVQKIQGYKGDWEQTQLLLVGSAVALAESMHLLEAKAGAASKDNEGLDWANFDCYACHHDLRAPSWRQTRGYEGKPGRVPMKSWPALLTRLAAELAQKEEGTGTVVAASWSQRERNLREAFEERPFGNLSKIQINAGEWANWADALANRISKLPCGPAQMEKALHLLPTLLGDRLADYDTARQAAWALNVLRDEEKSITKKDRPELDRLLLEVEKELALKLPAGRKESIRLRQGDLLKTLYGYDPQKFRDWIGKVNDALKR